MQWVIRLGSVVLVLVILVVALILLIPAERVARMAADRFEAMTGRELRFEGEISPRFFPVLGVKTGPVTIANAAWSDQDAPIFAAESLTVEINASALLGGDIRILGITAERPRLLLERAKDGRVNWDFSGQTAATTTPSPEAAEPAAGPRAFALERGLIKGGQLRYIDHAAATDVSFDALEVDLAIPDFNGAFNLNASAITSGQKLRLASKGEAFSTALEGRAVPMTLEAQIGGATARFAGRAGFDPLLLEGDLQADLSDLAAIGALSGSPIATPPQGFGAEVLQLAGKLALDAKGALSLREARITADQNLLTGDLTLEQGAARPKISGDLHAQSLNLAAWSRGQGGGASGGMQAQGWPNTPMDVQALGKIDAALSLSVGAIDLGAIKFGESQMGLSIDRARAVFDIRDMVAYGGAVSGEFVVNGRGGLSAGGALSLAGIQTEPLLKDLAGWDRLAAQGNLTLKFLAVGNTMDALMNSLEGSGVVSLGTGELRGLDIGGMLRNLDTSYVGAGQKTIFDGIAGTFTIKDGNLQNDDLTLVAPYLNATGMGRIGLGPRDLDYRIRPIAFPGEDGTGGVMVPLRITGAWAKPTYRLDLESIAREKMEAEAKEAEARAKAALEAKLKAELGVEAQEGEGLEDAAKRRAREALEKEAGKLLQGILGAN